MPEIVHPLMPIAREGPIAIVTFNRPEVRNAFDLAMWRGLQARMEALSADDELRCVVLRGAGTEAFCAGADISAFADERGTPGAGGRIRRMCWTQPCSRSGCAGIRWWR